MKSSLGKPCPSLVMVGTVHRDPKGYSKLLRLLDEEHPKVLTVEISRYARKFRDQRVPSLRALLRENLKKIHREKGWPLKKIYSHPAIQSIFFILKEPYEWRAAARYATQHGMMIQDVDLSSYSRRKLSYMAELVAKDNLWSLLQTSPIPDLTRQVEIQYSRANLLMAHPSFVRWETQELKKRELYMAAQIRRFVDRRKKEKILHIGGWEHLLEFPGEDSLFTLLKDLRPQRILLPLKAI
jgi:hypothetical protein